MLSGFVLLDKPSGMTSFQAVLGVKNILGVIKAGHTGTLDTNTRGLLIIGLGEAVKSISLLMGLNKKYAGVMQLHKDVGEIELKNTCKEFVGKITQMPPVKSNVLRKPREREIYSIKILSLTGRKAGFEVECEAGTYIRKLVHDIGTKLGGAHLADLRRTSVGPFSVRESVTLENLSEKNVFPIGNVLDRIKKKTL